MFTSEGRCGEVAGMDPTMGRRVWVAIADEHGGVRQRRGHGRAGRLQCSITALVATGAAYASFRHGRDFGLRFGADEVTATIWPLLVDGLLTMATVELWKTGRRRRDSGRWTAWVSFLFGVTLSLCANVMAAPS